MFGKWKESEMRIYISLAPTAGLQFPKGHEMLWPTLLSDKLRENLNYCQHFPFKL